MGFKDVLYPCVAGLVTTLGVLSISTFIGRQVTTDSIDVDLAVLIGAIAGFTVSVLRHTN